MTSVMLTKDPAVVIGDLVQSRRATDRAQLHAELLAALAIANETLDPLEPLMPTVGDEFQGAFRSVVEALRATVLVRASMSVAHDARFGVGVGPVTGLGEPRDGAPQQDGPGWWVARDAIDYVATAATGRTVPRSLRTWIATAQPEHLRGQYLFPFVVEQSEDPQVRSLNAYLVTRDHLVTQMDDRDRRILQGLLLRRTVSEIATQEGITPSAVSQRSQRSGAAALVFANDALAGGYR